jgi:hypothetical protein
MQGKDFLYFLTDAQNRSFYVENGLVQVSSAPRPLEFTPGEWQNVLVDNTRNQKYFALDRSFSIPLNAVEDGAKILKDQYYKKGIETIVNLVILRQDIFYDGTEYGYFYRGFYKGELDFSNFNHHGAIVTINVMEGGLPKLIKAKENLVYEIPMDHPDAETILMDGIVLKEAANYTAVDVELKKSLFGTYFIVPLIFLSSDSSANPGVFFYSPTVQYMGSNFFNFMKESFNVVAQADPGNAGPVVLNINGQLIYKVTQNGGNLGIRLRFFKSSQTAANQNTYLLTTTPVGGSTAGVTYTSNVSLAISLQPDERLFFFVEYIGTTGANDTVIVFQPQSTLRITYDFRYKKTYINALTPGTVFRELIKHISDSTHIPQSNLLSLWDNIKLTCGDAIRGIQGAVLKTSLSDFFQAFDSQFDTGLGIIAGVLRLEYKADFVDYNNPIHLGSVKGLSVKPSKDQLYNSLVVGYRDITYDDVNGKQEFNSRTTWSLPNTRITKELSKISPYRADSYGIEFLRINLEGKNTTDSSSDNDVFMIHTRKYPTTFPQELITAYEVDRGLNTGAGGMIETATPFNFFLSPKRMLERNGRHLHSFFYKQDSLFIKFLTADKNKEMTSGGIVEKGDVLIGNLPLAYFTPNELEFEAPPPLGLVEFLEASPVRAFQFDYLGMGFRGIAIKAPIKPASNEAQTFQLLSAPDNDLTQLIEVFE